jgi:hypothetical protein
MPGTPKKRAAMVAVQDKADEVVRLAEDGKTVREIGEAVRLALPARACLADARRPERVVGFGAQVARSLGGGGKPYGAEAGYARHHPGRPGVVAGTCNGWRSG